MKKYELINLEGCTMDTVMSNNFKLAKNIFKSKYEGKFKIVYVNDEETETISKNVIL